MFSFRTTPLQEQMDKALREGRVGCFCTQNSWDTASGRYVHELFRSRGNLAAVFSPGGSELSSDDGHIEAPREQLETLRAVVVEIQDAGSRYFGYTRDVMMLMDSLDSLERSGAECPSLYIVDHVNPAGRVVEGTIPTVFDEKGVPKVAHRHGLTLGELCYLYYNEISARFPLHIISALATESNKDLLPWTIAPSSDIPGMFTCYMYSGGALWKGTSITPGIGTPRPYEYIGAPFIKPSSDELLPSPDGVLMRPCSFTPLFGRYAGERCNGWQIILTPGAEYHSLLHTVRLMKHVSDRYSQFEYSPEFFSMLADPVIEEYLKGNITFDIVQEHVKTEEQKWIRKAKRFLLYDDAPYRIK